MTTTWIATHTGLPSFRVPPTQTTPWTIKAQAGPRQWTVHQGKGNRDEIFSDPFATPGEPTTYTLPDGSQATLTRTTHEWFKGLISGLNGRPIRDLAWDADGDKRQWDSGIHEFNTRYARWPLRTPNKQGSGTFTLLNPAREQEAWDVLQKRTPLILHPAEPTPTVPSRIIVVNQASRTRIYGNGTLEFQASWTEFPFDSPLLHRGRQPAAVVTWGEWAELGHGWQNRTYEDLCKEIAGMP